ncbi:MAG: hypothetical protein ABIG71_03880, partial [Candidatus Uhrbacteria bacterium]
ADNATSKFESLTNMQNVDYVRVYVPRGATLLSAAGFVLPPAEAFHGIPTDAIPDRHLLATELDAHIDEQALVRITEEFGRTVFGGWIITPAGETQSVALTYELPQVIQHTEKSFFGRSISASPQPYTLLIQKQSGSNTHITHTVALAPEWVASWTSDTLIEQSQGQWTASDTLTSDRLLGIMVEPRSTENQ